MKKILALVFLLSVYAVPLQAAPPERGYRVCEAAIMNEYKHDGVMAAQTYYFRRSGDRLEYYINGSIWGEDGNRVAGRATCLTSANGRRLLEFKTDFGSFSLDGQAIVVR